MERPRVATLTVMNAPRPVWPMIDQPVPASDVPGEKAAATQPIPSKPPAFDVQGVRVEDLARLHPRLAGDPFASGRDPAREFSNPSCKWWPHVVHAQIDSSRCTSPTSFWFMT